MHGKLGRADTATDPAPLTMIETTIQLKPEQEWRPGMTMERMGEISAGDEVTLMLVKESDGMYAIGAMMPN